MNTVKVYLFLRLCRSSLNFNFVVLCKEIPKTKEIMGHQASAIRNGALLFLGFICYFSLSNFFLFYFGSFFYSSVPLPSLFSSFLLNTFKS